MLTRIRLALEAYRRAYALRHKPKNIRGRDWRHAFLHIGKNAGSTIGDFLLGVAERGHRAPVVLGHDWTLEIVALRYPRMQISFVLRDPLDRIVSGFNSRLRQGRPRNQNTWQPAEAAAFAHFPRVEDFLDACISDDAYAQSAARFARQHIQHVRDGYVHHFGSVEVLRRERRRVHCVGHVDDIDAFLARLLAPLGVDYASVASLLADKHRAAVPSESVLDRYDDAQRARLRAFFADEYAIYDELLAMAGR